MDREQFNSDPGQQPNDTSWEGLASFGDDLAEKERLAKEFTSRELERLARITGRVPDDDGVIALNLALRYEKFKQAKELYERHMKANQASRTKTTLQSSTLEDIATAKRELEEAMYLYDKRFGRMDEDLRKKQAKDSYRAQTGRVTGRAVHEEPGHYLKMQEARRARTEGKDIRFGKHGVEHVPGFDERRAAAAEGLSSRLEDIVEGIKRDEVYQTYEWNKDELPEESVRSRRAGFDDVGKNGLFVEGRNDQVDWVLYPQAPQVSDSEPNKNGDDGNNPDGGDGGPNGDDGKNPNGDDGKNPDGGDGDPDGGDGDPNGDDGNNPDGGDGGPNGGDGDPDGGDGDPDGGGVEIGDIDIEGIELEFGESKAELIDEIAEKLNKLAPQLGELYARNRRLIVGAENRAAFQKVKGEYGELLDKYLELKAGETHEKGRREIAQRLEERIGQLRDEIEARLIEFAGGNLENTEKTQEEMDAEKERLIREAEAVLRSEYQEMIKALEEKVDAGFLRDFIANAKGLEESTIDALDNGTLCRQFVSKILNNKALQVVAATAAVAGLAISGIGIGMGIAAGTMSIGASYTAAGVALGAARGGLAGLFGSRQDSKNSAIRGFASEEEIRELLKDKNILSAGGDAANVGSWLMGQYGGANTQDRSSNQKRTLIAAGIGAIFGGLMSGVKVSNKTPDQIINEQVANPDYRPPEIRAANLDNVDIPEGYGAMETFTDLGGNPSDYSKFEEIMFSYDAKYGLVPGSNGEVPGLNGAIGNYAHTYPGRIETWPDVAQQYITEVANEAARQGLIPGYQVGGSGAPYTTITRIVEGELIPNAFYNFLVQATATLGSLSIIGNAIGGKPTAENERTRDESIDDILNTFDEDTSEPIATAENTQTREEIIDELLNDLDEDAGEPIETAPLNDYESLVREQLGDYLDENGIDILLNDEDFVEGTNLENQINSWWATLPESSKDLIVNFESNRIGDAQGRAIRQWLQRQNLLPGGEV